jgi:hypothetical protein
MAPRMRSTTSRITDTASRPSGRKKESLVARFGVRGVFESSIENQLVEIWSVICAPTVVINESPGELNYRIESMGLSRISHHAGGE